MFSVSDSTEISVNASVISNERVSYFVETDEGNCQSFAASTLTSAAPPMITSAAAMMSHVLVDLVILFLLPDEQ